MNNKGKNIKKETYIKENILKDHPTLLTSLQLKNIQKYMDNSICFTQLNPIGHGTGFFCKIPFPYPCHLLPVLITNEHVLKKMI